MEQLYEIHCAALPIAWQNKDMPRIKTASLVEHREWRRQQLISAATAIALESGGESISVAAVAARAGLSRTSVYEYFASSADLAADLVIEELKSFTSLLESAIADAQDPATAIAAWISTSLSYIADGRHLLAKALNAIDLPRERAASVGAAHRAMLAPLASNLSAMGVADTAQAMALLQAATDTATRRIEAGHSAEQEVATTTAFALAGLRALAC
jgi:AcrR family transcriptional regulator